MIRRTDLIQVVLDSSAMTQLLDRYESQLKRHGEQIQELFRLVTSLPTKSDFDRLRAEVRDEAQAIVRDLNPKVHALEKDARNTDGLRDDFNSLSEHVDECESQLKKTSDHVQTIASAYASLARTSAPLDSDLPRTLFNTSQHVHSNFTKIFDTLKDLRNRIDTCYDSASAIPREVTVEAPKIDLSKLHLRGESPATFEDPPDLPELHRFSEIAEPVDYIYELVPRLQGILRCHHAKISSLERPPPELQDMLERVRASMARMGRELEELRGKLGQGVSRSDVARMIRNSHGVDDDDGGDETAVGIVHCIACGREMRQVVGAMTEHEALRVLGAPVTSIPIATGTIGQMYTNSKTINRNRESPRSVRPPRRPKVVKQMRWSG
jgi:Skp family chaperone for outer membrane proteins